MNTILVRECTRGDISQIATLGRDTFRHTYAATAPAAELGAHIEAQFGEAAVARDLARPAVKYFMAESGEQCAGFVKLCEPAAYDFEEIRDAREVRQLYVSPEFQRRGVGRLLMDAAVRHARDAGAAGVVLSVWAEAGWATAFYRGYGFRNLGEVPYFLGATEYVDWLMWLPISRAG